MRCPTLSELPPPPSGKAGWPWTEESPQLPDTMSGGSPWPRVSIVTPSYNQAQFIEETIRSVLLQGYPDLEYIIIDGGSTDGSVEIIRKYEPWLAYWVSEPDGGQSEAINKGWACSQGDIMAWLNSDDTYNPGAMRIAVECLRAHPSVGMVYGNSNVIDSESQITGYIESEPLTLEGILGMGQRYIPQETTFIWRHVLQRVGLVDPTLHYAMDYDLWVRIARVFRLYYIPETLANFRVWAKSKTVSQSDQWLSEMVRILDRTFNDADIGDDTDLIKSVAYSQLYWTRGVSTYAQGHAELGRKFCRLALEQPAWVRRNIQKVVSPLVHGEKSISEDRRKDFIQQILADLPKTVKETHDLERLVWREYYASRVFMAHRRRGRAAVIKSFCSMLLHQPSCIRNLGIISVVLENIIGTRVMSKLRNLTHALRAIIPVRQAKERKPV